MIRRAEQLAWGAFGGLVAMAIVLLIGALMYRFTAFWAGMMLVSGQAVVMGLAAWGLGLARQSREFADTSLSVSKFRLKPHQDEREEQERKIAQTGQGMAVGNLVGHAVGGHIGGAIGSIVGAKLGSMESREKASEPETMLDTGFQRLVVGITAGILVILAAVSIWGVYDIYGWTVANPEKTLPVAGALTAKVPTVFDELALLIGVASALGYGALWWMTRPSRRTGIYGDASSSNFTIGLTAMAALGAATVLGYFKVAWAAEIAAAVIAAFMLLQGLELIVNACRNYSGIDEFEQDAVDLQATPLVPMLSSVWLGGLRMLLAQSVGLSHGGAHKGDKGVIARTMPRVLLAIVVIAVIVSCIRVVPPGQVAVRERLGYTPTVGPEDPRPLKEAILQPGLHFTLPWPIDQLVYLPTQELQLANVGTELHAVGDWKNVDFQFWMVRPPGADQQELNDLFVTGDEGSPQFLETYIEVRWRVADPARFYATMSHSETFDASSPDRVTTIYEALVQQATSESVTKAFSIHSLEQILLTSREEVESHCKMILQQRLDKLCTVPGEKLGDIELNRLKSKKEIETLTAWGNITINGQSIDLSSAKTFADVIKAINTNTQGVVASVNDDDYTLTLAGKGPFTVADGGSGTLASLLKIAGTSAASGDKSTIVSRNLRFLCRGIEVAYLTIKDLHPPYWHPDRPDSTAPVIGGVVENPDAYPWRIIDNPQQSTQLARGPASAFELVVAMREFRQQLINLAETRATVAKTQAHGEAESAKADAEAYKIRKLAQARGDADRFVEMTKGLSAIDLDLLKLRLSLDTTRDLYEPVLKIVVDPRVGGVQIIQNSEKGTQVPFRPPGQ